MLAARLDEIEIVHILLSKGAQIDARDPEGNTALHFAALIGNTKSVEVLIGAGANVNVSNYHGWTPLMESASTGSYECVRVFLGKGANVNARSDEGNTSLILLVKSTNPSDIQNLKGWKRIWLPWDPLKTLQILLEKGADVNAKNNKGQTALSAAEENGVAEFIELLRRAGAKS
jgi:ankyrin repeat protein